MVFLKYDINSIRKEERNRETNIKIEAIISNAKRQQNVMSTQRHMHKNTHVCRRLRKEMATRHLR